MISDVLSHAVDECRRYLDDPTFGTVYQGDMRARIEGLVKAMNEIRNELDTPPDADD